VGKQPFDQERQAAGLGGNAGARERRLARRVLQICVAGIVLVATSTVQAHDEATAACERGPDVAGYYCFYPYVTSYAEIDPGYAFGTDPLGGRVYRPRVEAAIDRTRRPAPALLRPRVSYADHLLGATGEL
jgi:hypothetical protein